MNALEYEVQVLTILICAFFGLKGKKKDHPYMGEEEKKKRKDLTQIFWVGMHELDWIGSTVFFKQPGTENLQPKVALNLQFRPCIIIIF